MTAGIVPISTSDRRARIDKARRLMAENHIDAILLEGGSSLFYFTGVRWGLSERPFVAVIPAKGELAWVSPGFEEARARELIEIGGRDLRTWQEDESPYRLVAQILKDRGVTTGRVGVEERLRFFVFNGVKKEAPAIDYVSADPVTAGCRMIKSPAEIALMQRANDMTIAAYKAGLATLREGMTQGDLRNNILAAYRALGAQGGVVAVSFGKYTAFPHGSITPQKLNEGDVVQIDDGCNVDGYQSDITRTVVFGKPTKRQIDVWNLEHRAQAAAFAGREAGRAVRSGRRRGAQGDHRRRLRSRLQGAGPAAPHRPRHRPRRPRVDQLRARQQDAAAAGHVLQRRADDRDLRRVRDSTRGLSVHHRERREVLHAAEPGDRSTLCLIDAAERRAPVARENAASRHGYGKTVRLFGPGGRCSRKYRAMSE